MGDRNEAPAAGSMWLIAAGQAGDLWTEFQKHGIAAIGYYDVGDLGQYCSREAIECVLMKKYPKCDPKHPNKITRPTNDSLALWQFGPNSKDGGVKVGDLLIARSGLNTIVGSGTVNDNCTYKPERRICYYVRSIEWHPGRISITESLPRKAFTRVTSVLRHKYLESICEP